MVSDSTLYQRWIPIIIWKGLLVFTSIQFSSVIQSCPTLSNRMNRSMPGLPVHHQLLDLPKLICIELVMPSSHLILCRPLLLLPPSLPASGSFPMNWLFAWGGQSIGVSASASILPMNTQDWSPLGWTGWISLQSKGLSRVFFQHHTSKASILQRSAFFTIQLSHLYTTTGKTTGSTRQTFVGKVMSLIFNILSRLVITFLPRSKHLLE